MFRIDITYLDDETGERKALPTCLNAEPFWPAHAAIFNRYDGIVSITTEYEDGTQFKYTKEKT